MYFSMRSRRLVVVAGVAAAGLALAAAPAHASGGPTGNGNINASATVGSSLTLTLSSTSLLVNTPAGVVTDTTTTNPITATVTTNDVAGYQLSEAITTNPPGVIGKFFGTANPSNVLLGSNISPFSYTSVGTLASSPIGGGFGSGGFLGLYATSSMSAPAGDAFPLRWEFTPPASQAADTYTGAFSLLAAGN